MGKRNRERKERIKKGEEMPIAVQVSKEQKERLAKLGLVVPGGLVVPKVKVKWTPGK